MSGMFGAKPDWGQAIAAALNGYLAAGGNQVGAANLKQMYAQRQAKADAEAAEAEYQRKRGDQWTDWQQREQWKLEHPNAPQPTEYERMLQAGGILPGTPEYLKHVRNYVQMRENPMVMTPYGPMPYSQVSGAQQPEILQDLPQGAKPIGGQTGPSLSGPFPDIGPYHRY